METKLTAQRPRRRQYSAPFKADILTQCREPNASIVGVALANGLHSNMVHRWLRESQMAERTNKVESSPLTSARCVHGTPSCAGQVGVRLLPKPETKAR